MDKRNICMTKPFNSRHLADSSIAIFLIILGLPLYAAVSMVVWIKMGRPIFYRGERLGKDKKIFHIYKFRTLPNNAQQNIIGSELLSSKHRLTTPFTEFLRDTRIDELPQLLNVAKGEMSFIGPRPERPEVYQEVCQKIHNYDKRFAVPPGLLGYSQLFTPHGTPKKMRTLVDNAYIYQQNSFWKTLKIILYTVGAVCLRILMRLRHNLDDLVQRRILKRYSEKRKEVRKKLPKTQVDIIYHQEVGPDIVAKADLVNMNEEAFLIYTNDELPDKKELMYLFTIPNIKRRHSHVPYKTARCNGCILRKVTPGNDAYKYGYVIFYDPMSPFNTYLIEQYILHASLAY